MKLRFAAILCLLCAATSCVPEEKEQSKNLAPDGPVRANVDTVGTKGKDRGGYLSTVVAEKYRSKDRITLMAADYNLKLYKASTGRLPADMDEFRKELVENPQYMVQLPELPQGAHYEYDPNEGPNGTLWVVPDGKTFRDAADPPDGFGGDDIQAGNAGSGQ